jgi:succinyl-diaminopimelate desuccinylase
VALDSFLVAGIDLVRSGYHVQRRHRQRRRLADMWIRATGKTHLFLRERSRNPVKFDPDRLPLERLVAFARDLIEIPTVNPPGNAYGECVDRIALELETLGLPWELVESGTARTPRHVIISTPSPPGPPLYLHGHYDVVPAFSPQQFNAREEGGHLVGRGASDMKGGLASIIYAAWACADRGVPAALIIVPDEETGGQLGAERLAELELIDADAHGAIVAEPTWGTIWHACRGAFTLRVLVRGRAAHVGLHYRGRNAFTDALALVNELAPLRDELTTRHSPLQFGSEDPRASQSILLLGGHAEGGVNFNVVPDRFSFTIDRRPNPEEDHDKARDELLSALENARLSQGLDVIWDVLQDCTGGMTAPDDPLIQAVVASTEHHTGTRPTITCCPGVLETRIYQRLGIPAIAFGPGLVEQMHGPDENVPTANLTRAAAIYAEVASQLAAAQQRA